MGSIAAVTPATVSVNENACGGAAVLAILFIDAGDLFARCFIRVHETEI